MAFEVFENSSESHDIAPYFLDIQHDRARRLNSRIVVPLHLHKPTRSDTDFILPVNFGEGVLYAIVPHMAAVPRDALGHRVGSLPHCYETIRDAVDKLFTGV